MDSRILWRRLLAWWALPGACHGAAAAGVVVAGPVDDELPQPAEPVWGCGWFDSSLDLRQGLRVIEHDGIDHGLVELLAVGA